MAPNPFETVVEQVDTAPVVSDRVAHTTCYMCACRCGIRVHMKEEKIRYIEGNPDHPVNQGVLCAKGSAGIMTQYSPAKLKKPLLRVGKRGEGKFKEIEWDEALALATEWLGGVRKTDPRKLAFFTGRDQSQSLTGWWAAQFGTPNFAAHGGFCSVNMAAGGLYTVGGAFWEFGEVDWERTRYFMMFGVAEDHDSNPIKMGLGKLKTAGKGKFVSVNPVKTGYSAIADEWVGIRPGTDGLFVMALIHELIRAEKIDWDFLVRYTNAPWLVIDAPGTADHGLFARDSEGRVLAWDAREDRAVDAQRADISPALVGTRILADGRRARPSFEHLALRYMDERYAPDRVAAETGVPAATIRRIAAELAEAAFESEVEIPVAWTDWAGRRHDSIVGRPVAMHAMRGISAHSNGFHTCRAIHVLQVLLGSIDAPGGFRYKAPFPKPIPPGPKPAGKDAKPMHPLGGMPLGFPLGPEDLLVEADGTPKRIDKAYSWEYPIAAHGLMHMVIHNAWKGDPYPVDVLFMYMANMGWNSSMNIAGTLHYLTDTHEDGSYKIPKVIYSDAFWSETVPYADLVLPDTTYLERWDCISILDRPICSAEGPADAIRHPVIKPDRDVRPFQDVLIELGARLKLPGFVTDAGDALYPGGYPDYIVNHQRGPGIGPLAGFRGADGSKQGRGEPNPNQLQAYIDNGAFWQHELPMDQQFMKHANKSYLDYAASMGWIPEAKQIVMQLYSEPMQKFRLAAEGHGAAQPPDHLRERIQRYFDPLPFWYPPFEGQAVSDEAYPIHALTQRPMHMYHSWGTQNAWLRQITAQNRLFVHDALADRLGLANDDWVWIISHHGRVKGQIRRMAGVNPDTVWTWNAIGKRAGAWGLTKDAPEAQSGFLLNHVISELLPPRGDGHRYSNSDPVTGQAAWYDLKVRIEKCLPEEAGATEPGFDMLPAVPGGFGERPARMGYGAGMQAKGQGRMGTATHAEWIGNRHAAVEAGVQIPDGHGNRLAGSRRSDDGEGGAS